MIALKFTRTITTQVQRHSYSWHRISLIRPLCITHQSRIFASPFANQTNFVIPKKLTGATVRHDGRTEEGPGLGLLPLQQETNSFVSFHEEVETPKFCVRPHHFLLPQAHASAFSRINKVWDSVLAVWRCWHVMVTGTRLLIFMRPSGESPRESVSTHFVVATSTWHTVCVTVVPVRPLFVSASLR